MSSRQILPTNVRPRHYALALTPDLDTFTFSGQVTIDIGVLEQTSTFVLNALELDVHSAKFYSTTGKTEQTYIASNVDLDTAKQTLTLTFPVPVPAGATGQLVIAFTGTINDQMCGFYRSSYTGSDGTKRYMGATQFAATDARRAFPCWDEPAIKATFDVALNVPRHMTTLSNMNVVSESEVKGESARKLVTFATTPAMSTYLLAFVVGELDYVEASSSGAKNGTPILCRVYTPPGQSEEGEFALDIATRTLEYFAGIFGQPYPLPKMDLIALPDFSMGAMENWGLVTFRTTALLWDKTSSSVNAKLRVAGVVAHELAHQWFGNLVTMAWWSDLWLNEGFATWVGWLAVDHLFPEWTIWNQFVADTVYSGLALDALRSSHPIEVRVDDATEIMQIFDAISYSKGGSVLRMLSDYLGIDVFLAGIRRYLKRHSYANASTDDLWHALSEESGLDVSTFMAAWTRQIGYPVLTVTSVDKAAFTVRQNRFLSSGDVSDAEDANLWWVPLALATESGQAANTADQTAALTARQGQFATPPHAVFFKLNHRQSGVYRVQYPKEHLDRLAQAIRAGQMVEVADRISVLSDAAALAVSGAGSTANVLSLLTSFENETEYLVWSEVNDHLTSIASLWFEQPEAERAALDAIAIRLFATQVQRLGWDPREDEGFLAAQLRTLAIQCAGMSGHKSVIEEARARFTKFITGNQAALHPDVRSPAFRIVVKYGGAEEFDAVLKQYRETKTADQKIAALSALAQTQDAALLDRLLNLSLSEEDVRPQDTIHLYRAVADNTMACRILWRFMQEKYDQLAGRYKAMPPMLGAAVKCACVRFSTRKDADEIEAFFAARDHRLVERAVQQSVERVRSNAAWLERAKDEVSAWLREHAASAPTSTGAAV
ncbi:peptidase family M1-domain-containing protein [Thamnocephalis sphaerospora]|uniref:Aminopeptidase n=1 Tax=Thamnocephalis sphaerospora TaxID=78915 RepID=A0A4P9XNW3_9FUNG|nr:peptidase family M1-domain-containing protein [Thamnocephalis sphaerospora]|eukprot:RKP07532.1 peptidase family M1-domain-containing protein [Thamnocephalis sphaerospora]